MGVDVTLRRLLRRSGIDLIPYRPEKSWPAQMQRVFERFRFDLVLDVGANIGQYATWLRSIGYAGHIVSFEPLRSAHDALRVQARGDARWDVAPRLALGRERGSATINVSRNSQSSSLLGILPAHLDSAPESRYIGQETVDLDTLDNAAQSYVRERGAVLLKIDTQGYESEVLAGATQTLGRVHAVQLELSLVALYEGQALMCETIGAMGVRGFTCFAMWPTFVDPDSGRLLQMDGVFVRQDLLVQGAR